MTAAIFGLVGVIIGGVLNASLSYVLERAREHRATRAAVRLLLFEASNSNLRLSDALTEQTWRPIADGVKFDEWNDHRQLLAHAVTTNEWLDIWTGQRALQTAASLAQARRGLPALNTEDVKRLRELQERASKLVMVLIELEGKTPRWRPEIRRRLRRLTPAARRRRAVGARDEDAPF